MAAHLTRVAKEVRHNAAIAWVDDARVDVRVNGWVIRLGLGAQYPFEAPAVAFRADGADPDADWIVYPAEDLVHAWTPALALHAWALMVALAIPEWRDALRWREEHLFEQAIVEMHPDRSEALFDRAAVLEALADSIDVAETTRASGVAVEPAPRATSPFADSDHEI